MSNSLGPLMKPFRIQLFPAYTLYTHSFQIAWIQVITTECFTYFSLSCSTLYPTFVFIYPSIHPSIYLSYNIYKYFTCLQSRGISEHATFFSSVSSFHLSIHPSHCPFIKFLLNVKVKDGQTGLNPSS